MQPKGILELDFRGPDNQPLHDEIDIRLDHQVLSDRRLIRAVDASKTLVIEGLHPMPQGLYLLTITPRHHRRIRRLVTIAASGSTHLTLSFGVTPSACRTPRLRVLVLDARRHRLERARVVARGTHGETLLQLDPRHHDYRTDVLDPGDYKLEIEAPGFADQKRDIVLPVSGTREIFLLGAEHQPHYYKGRVQVPFEPRHDLIAASVSADLDPATDKELSAFAADEGLDTIPLDPILRKSAVRLFQIAEGGSLERAQKRLERHPAVRQAGALLELGEKALTFLTRDLVVRFGRQVSREQVPVLAARRHLEVVRALPYIPNGFVLRREGPADYGVLDLCDELVSEGLAEYAEPNAVASAMPFFTPDDPRLVDQPNHAIIHSEEAWDHTLGSSQIRIAVLDDGCDIAHDDLTNPLGTPWDKIVDPFDFATNGTDPYNPDSSHGSRSTGMAAGVADNATGIAGVAPGCQVMPLRWPAGWPLDRWADVFIWMAGLDPGLSPPFPNPIHPGADVLSNSIGVNDFPISGTMNDVFDHLTTYGRGGRGCVVVFAAGNDDGDLATEPFAAWAAHPRTLAVAASTNSPPDLAEQKVSTSNFGDEIDLCAPAGGPSGSPETRTLSTGNDDGYASFGQTSCACPQVAGAAALLLSIDPTLTWREVRNILRASAFPIDVANVDPMGHWVDAGGLATTEPAAAEFSPWYGHGRLDVGAALDQASGAIDSVDLLIRDTLADVGTVPVSGTFYDSPDLWVRNDSPADEGLLALPPDDDTPGPHLPPLASQDNWIYVRVFNNGTAPSDDFEVRVYITHWPGTEFTYPESFVPTNPPGTSPAPITEEGTFLIDRVTATDLAPGTSTTLSLRWPVELMPPETILLGGMPVAWHPCLLAEVSPHDGPPPSGVHVWDDNNLAQKNITIEWLETGEDFKAGMVFGNRRNPSPFLFLEIDRSRVPRGIDLWVDLVKPELTQRLRDFIEQQEAVFRPATCGLTFLEATKVRLECPGVEAGHNPVMTVQPHTRLSQLLATATEERPSFALALRQHPEGREIVHLEGHHKCHLPVVHGRGGITPLIVGGVAHPGTPSGTYPLYLTQRNPDGRVTGSAQIQLRLS